MFVPKTIIGECPTKMFHHITSHLPKSSKVLLSPSMSQFSIFHKCVSCLVVHKGTGEPTFCSKKTKEFLNKVKIFLTIKKYYKIVKCLQNKYVQNIYFSVYFLEFYPNCYCTGSVYSHVILIPD